MSTVSESQKANLFSFMLVRPPDELDPKTGWQPFIHDDHIKTDGEFVRKDVDILSTQSPSTIARLVYDAIYCKPSAGNPAEDLQDLIKNVLRLYPAFTPRCPEGSNITPSGIPERGGRRRRTRLGSVEEAPPTANTASSPESRTQIQWGDTYYQLPDKITSIRDLPLADQLLSALDIVDRHLERFNHQALLKEMRALFDDSELYSLVFDETGRSESFVQIRRLLFDNLYKLYILRRHTPVDLGPTIRGLQVVHVLEALAFDEIFRAMRDRSLSSGETYLEELLEGLFPFLRTWDRRSALDQFPLISSASRLQIFSGATPVIHPLFARLFFYRRPFNDIKPIGIGDLKIVKQWLCGYEPGEISHIENILKGESKERTHRRLEKSEDVFYSSFSSEQSTQQDSQTTEKHELKREVEQVVKNEFNVGAQASFTYSQMPIVATVSGNLSVKKDQTDTLKTADNFWRDVVSKALERVETKTASTRTATRILETEEMNKHAFNNKSGRRHISGIYRWLDKRYKAQLYNYGKRMMFEFIVPEPAAFLVESKLRDFENNLDVPQPPAQPPLLGLQLPVTRNQLPLTPQLIDEEEFDLLRLKYDLSEFTYPQIHKQAALIDSASGEALFSARGLDSEYWQSKSYRCDLGSKGYRITGLNLRGRLHFWGAEREGGATAREDPNNLPAHDLNTFTINIDGYEVLWDLNNLIENWVYGPQPAHISVSGAPILSDDEVTLALGFMDIADFSMSITADLQLGEQALRDWQVAVYRKIVSYEQGRIEAANREAQLAYEAAMATYHAQLAELKTEALGAVLAGKSGLSNQETIRRELKRHCLTMLTKEFDADASDDVISSWSPLHNGPLTYSYHKMSVKEQGGATSATFTVSEGETPYPAIDILQARAKGRFVQFLEQAFEWQHVAYITYPYFWADRPKWVELMNRSDDAEEEWRAFMQAGSARVLVAVTPAYEQAVLHFLATREPWAGGPSPVIGDPLFIPLYEELRRQTDDLDGAVPEGEPWTYTVPTSLLYLHNSGDPLPVISCEPPAN